MDIIELDKNINTFIENKIKYIEKFLTTNEIDEDDFFLTGYTFLGKDYVEDVGFREVRGKHGIYIIYISQNIFLDFKQVFDFNESAKGGKFKKYKEHDLKVGDCLYVGSVTSKTLSLYSRINQHFKDSDGYGSLHLLNKNRKILKDKIKIITFPIKNKKLESNEIILKEIEKKLHEMLSPQIGSKRI